MGGILHDSPQPGVKLLLSVRALGLELEVKFRLQVRRSNGFVRRLVPDQPVRLIEEPADDLICIVATSRLLDFVRGALAELSRIGTEGASRTLGHDVEEPRLLELQLSMETLRLGLRGIDRCGDEPVRDDSIADCSGDDAPQLRPGEAESGEAEALYPRGARALRR